MAGRFDVTVYGARGDGMTDDTQAIQAAIDAAAAAGGGTVTMTAGTYRVSAGTAAEGCLRVKANVALEGAGMGATILALAEGAEGAAGILRGGGDNIRISRLTLDGNSEHTTGPVHAWVTDASTGVILDAVEARNAQGYGFDLRSPGSEVGVRNCIAWQNANDGFVTEGLVNSVLQDNSSYLNQGSGYALAGGVQLLDSEASRNGTDGVLLREGATGGSATVDGGTTYGNGRSGVRCEQVQEFKVNGLEVNNNGAYGIDVIDSQTGLVAYNKVYGNSLAAPSAEVRLTGTGITAQGNTVTGAQVGQQGIVEPPGSGDYNSVTDNLVSQVANTIIVHGAHSVSAGNRAFAFTFGSNVANTLGGSLARDVLFGNDGDDWMPWGQNSDVLIGGSGSDRLTGGGGNTVFRYLATTDSYRTASQSHADRVTGFVPDRHQLDLTALGFEGVGNGHFGTLRVVYDPAEGLTYLKALDPDINGNRFELVLEGNYQQLTDRAFQQAIRGHQGADSLHGTAAAESVFGNANNDFIFGAEGDDLLIGGQGGDQLQGGEGADLFVYTQLSDSLREATVTLDPRRDTLVDFNGADGDLIDVSALGFFELGDGYGGTLKLSVNASGTRTILKSMIEDRNGDHFELNLLGDHGQSLTGANIVWAHPQAPQVYATQPTEANLYRGLAGADTLRGLSGNDVLRGAGGNDRLEGGTGNDTLLGGQGADRLAGGSGADLFRYNSISESARSPSDTLVDTITDFSVYRDRIDLRSLSFTGLGDGHDGTLRVSYNERLDRTYLTDLDGDAQGRHFQLRLVGNLADTLTDNNLLITAPGQLQLLGGVGGLGPEEWAPA